MRKTRLLAILATGERSRGELASELGISSQLWLSRAYLSPLMETGYIAHRPWAPKLAAAALQASAQGEGCPDMNTTYTVDIHKGLTLLCPLRTQRAQRKEANMDMNRIREFLSRTGLGMFLVWGCAAVLFLAAVAFSPFWGKADMVVGVADERMTCIWR